MKAYWLSGNIAPEPIWTQRWEKKSQPLPELEPPIIQLVAQRYATELSRLLEEYPSKFSTHFLVYPSYTPRSLFLI
jgi:hypothetical protein